MATAQSPDNKASIGKAISVAVLIMAGANVLSKLLALVRMQVLAAFGGVSGNVDSYTFSFLLPELMNHFLASGVLSITFIPLFQKYLVDNDKERAWQVFSNLLTVGTIFFLPVLACCMIFAEPLVSRLAGANIDNPLRPEQLALTVRLTRIILPAQLFFFWGALLMGAQFAHKRFLLPSLSGVIYNGGIILGGIVLAHFMGLGIEGFSWGVLGGALVGSVLLQIPGALKAGMRFKPSFNVKDPDLIKYVVLTIPLILAATGTFANEVLFRVFGSRIPDGVGETAALEYAYRIMYMSVSIIGQSLAAGSYPFLSHLVAEKKFDEIHSLIKSLLAKSAALLMPISGIMLVLAGPVVSVLLQSGKFDANSVIATTGPLRYYLVGSFFLAGTQLVNRACYAHKNTWLPLLVNTSTVVASIPLYVFLTNTMMAEGIALASSVTGIVQFALIFVLFSWKFANRQATSTAMNLVKALGVALVGAGVSLFLRSRLMSFGIGDAPSRVEGLLVGLASGVPALALCMSLLVWMRVLSLKDIVRLVKRK